MGKFVTAWSQMSQCSVRIQTYLGRGGASGGGAAEAWSRQRGHAGAVDHTTTEALKAIIGGAGGAEGDGSRKDDAVTPGTEGQQLRAAADEAGTGSTAGTKEVLSGWLQHCETPIFKVFPRKAQEVELRTIESINKLNVNHAPIINPPQNEAKIWEQGQSMVKEGLALQYAQRACAGVQKE